MTALILSGGGALGAFEAGAIQSLRDSGDEFDPCVWQFDRRHQRIVCRAGQN